MRSITTRAAAVLAVIGSTIASSINGTLLKNCSCGFLDARNNRLFTDSIVVYFNETESIPTDAFLVESYENAYENGWNSLFRQGASLENVNIINASQSAASLPQSLGLYCDVATKDHLVVGGSIRTARQDIFFGSFRTLMRSTQPWSGGSALSMIINYNETESIEMDQTNQDDPADAWVIMVTQSQFPDRDLGVNYTEIAGNGTNSWDWVEFRVDWSRDEVKYSIADRIYRTVSRSQDAQLPQTPSALHLKHWSVGNWFSTQGPPKARSVANVGWVRFFFNSSLMNDMEHADFDARCDISDACDTDDLTLRGYSAYSSDALSQWSQEQPELQRLLAPTVISILSVSIIVFLLINASLLRVPWKKFKILRKVKEKHPEEAEFPAAEISESSRGESSGSKTMTAETTLVSLTAISSAIDLEVPILSGPSSAPASGYPDCEIERLGPLSGSTSMEDVTNRDSKHPSMFFKEEDLKGNELMEETKAIVTAILEEVQPERKAETKAEEHVYGRNHVAEKRTDYLIGLVAVSCFLITTTNFSLTFIPAAIDPINFDHYPSEIWARKTIAPFFLNPNWICPFFVTSPRFLVATFLRTGSLNSVAQKAVERPFRLLIPVTLIAALEYFLMDSGAINWLAYLPSITWTSWPFAAVPDTLGSFFNGVLELAYLIPNASPLIAFNYCTGVLWAIPVQLQGSWITLLGVIMIYEIKTPWKRMCFYAWCILVHWYALSWGTYFYLGILLTDLDVTYQWTKWLYARNHVYYTFIILCSLFAICSLGIDLVTEWINANCIAYEFGWHPDTETGLPIAQTPNAGYPPYFVPNMSGLSFSVFFQAVIEVSPLVQKLFTFKLLTYSYPHIFTIYLFHGFVFWSLGSMICTYLAARGLPYWANISIVGVCCYATIALVLPLLTPAVEVGNHMAEDFWENAWQEPASRKPTLYPFTKDLLESRQDLKWEMEEVADMDVEKGEGLKAPPLDINMISAGNGSNENGSERGEELKATSLDINMVSAGKDSNDNGLGMREGLKGTSLDIDVVGVEKDSNGRELEV
jgi:Glycosyl hydrolases family 16